MIDTIRLEVQGIQSTNNGLYRCLKEWGTGTTTYVVNKTRHLERELIVNNDKDTYSEKFHITNRQASSNYKITILASLPNDSMIVEFSVPKYFFGTNIFQFVESPFNEFFNYGDNTKIEYHFKKISSYLRKAILKFFDLEFTEIKVDYTKVYLRRLDICYNAVFLSKQDKLDYLNMQKQMIKKYDRGTKNRHYKESIFVSTKDYSFKIYDKGEEFRKSDFKKIKTRSSAVYFETEENQKKYKLHHSKNKTNEERLQDAGKEKLLDFSDRILRFEMTFRNSFLSYIYNNKIRGKNSVDWQTKKKAFYTKMKSLTNTTDSQPLIQGNQKLMKHISNSLSWSVDQGLTIYSYLEETYRLQNIKPSVKEDVNFWIPYYRREYKRMTSELNKERNFVLKGSSTVQYFSSANKVSSLTKTETTDILLEEDIFSELTQSFWDNCNQFMPKKYDSYSYMVKKLNEHNETVKHNREYLINAGLYSKELSPNFFKTIFLVLKSTTFKSYKDKIDMPYSTFQRIKTQLKTLGINENMVIADFNIEPDFTFESYYSEINRNLSYYYQFIDQSLSL